MKFWKFSTLAIAALLASVSMVSAADEESGAIAPADSAVLQLNTKNFKETLEQNPLVLVEFFAPWCGHCKTLGPEFVKAADELSKTLPNVKLGQVNCVEDEELCRQHEIKGYPTLKLAKGPFQQPDDYEGPREAAGIVDYMHKMSQPPVSIISDVADFVKKAKSELKPFVVQIVPKAAHAAHAKWNETYGEIAHLQRKFRSHYSIDSDSVIAKFAKLINVDISGDKPKYLVIHPNELKDVRVYEEEDFTAEKFAEWVSNAQVPDFGDINRDTYMIYMGSTLPLAYYFYNTPEQRANVEEFFKTKGKELRGKIAFVGLDATQFGRHAEILNMDPEIVPLFAIQDNTNGRKYGLNQTENPDPSIESMEAFLDKFLAGEAEPIVKSEPLPTPEDEDYDENVVKLVAHNYDDILGDDSKNIFVEYFAPWCGHCKKLVPVWSELGAHFKKEDDSVVIAKLDHTANDVDLAHNIEGYPTLIFYPAHGERDAKTGLRLGVLYEGQREFGSFVTFVKEQISGSDNVEESVEEAFPVADDLDVDVEEHDEL